MIEKVNEKTKQKGKIALIDIIKVAGAVVGAVALFIPLWTGIFQYKASIQQRIDENFRSVVEDLSSKDREKRLAAASKMSTFITKGKNYYDEAMDILVNSLSIELDYNVVNAITGSLEKISVNDYKKAIEKLVGIERDIEIQDYPLKLRAENAETDFNDGMNKFLKDKHRFKEKELSMLIKDLTKEMARKMKISIEREKEYKELQMHRQVVTDAITVLLSKVKEKNLPINYSYVSLNNALIIGFNLKDSNFERASLSHSTINETKFDNSNINHTIFTFSDITNSSFVNCTINSSLFDQANLKNVDFSNAEFKDVFFTGSDLTGSKFIGSKGLKAIYFYKVQNYDKAIFDDIDVKKNIEEELEHITDDEVRNYIKEKSTLYVRNNLLITLDAIKQKEEKKQ